MRMPLQPTAVLRVNLFITDLGFLLYWLASAIQLLPPDWLYKDHSNPIVIAWNWSFAPVDLAASVSGLLALWLAGRNSRLWVQVAVLSLALTFSAGLFALSFWALRGDFDVAWWAPNIYLVAWPLFCLRGLFPRSRSSAVQPC